MMKFFKDTSIFLIIILLLTGVTLEIAKETIKNKIREDNQLRIKTHIIEYPNTEDDSYDKLIGEKLRWRNKTLVFTNSGYRNMLLDRVFNDILTIRLKLLRLVKKVKTNVNKPIRSSLIFSMESIIFTIITSKIISRNMDGDKEDSLLLLY